MNLGLKGRIALVTGGSRGIGKAIAKSLAIEGAKIFICGRDYQALTDTKKEFGNEGLEVDCEEIDATKIEEVKSLMDKIDLTGGLDILVNNIGGVEGIAKFDELTDEDWFKIFDINLMIPVRFTKLAIPMLKKSGNARIINIASVPAKEPGFYNPHYGSIKAGLVNLSKHLARNYANNGILVNCICPSTIQGGAWYRDIKNIAHRENISIEEAENKLIEGVSAKSPLRRPGTVEEVADLVTFLSSSKASYITGTSTNVDGGTTRSI